MLMLDVTRIFALFRPQKRHCSMQTKGTVSDFLSFSSCIFLSARVMSRQAWDTALAVLGLALWRGHLEYFFSVHTAAQTSFIPRCGKGC